MDELLQRVAEIRGMPASLIQRSAQARAEKEGITIEAVLAEWAGEESSAEVTPADSQPTADAVASESADAPAAGTAPPVEITTDYLVQLAADAKRMPPKLILSSATARAEHGNTTLEVVLADWAGKDLDELKAAGASGATEESPEVPEEAPTDASEPDDSPDADQTSKVVAATAVVGAALTMDELLEKVAEVKGMPASLAKRSAEARSKKTGEPVEAVLAEWAGVDVGAIAEASEDTTVTEEADKPADEPARAPEKTESEGPEVIEAEAPEIDEPVEDEAPVARGGYPRWLAAAFVLIPLLAVTYILVAPNGPDCGSAGQLHVDPETGIALNCDGTEYGTDAVDYMAVGAGVYAQCVACHSADGAGGAGPAFTGGALLSTFPAGSCSDHIEWVAVGTSGWPEPTYGASNKPVGGFGLMPAFGTTLTEEELASVALYERVEFGGQVLEEAQTDCGLGGETEDGGTATEAAGS